MPTLRRKFAENHENILEQFVLAVASKMKIILLLKAMKFNMFFSPDTQHHFVIFNGQIICVWTIVLKVSYFTCTRVLYISLSMRENIVRMGQEKLSGPDEVVRHDVSFFAMKYADCNPMVCPETPKKLVLCGKNSHFLFHFDPIRLHGLPMADMTT